MLVGGAAQVGLGLARAVAASGTSAPVVAVQVAGWNIGNAAVLIGTRLGLTALLDLGGALLVSTLFLMTRGLWPSQTWPANGVRTWCLLGYCSLLLILLVSIPVGLVLARA